MSYLIDTNILFRFFNTDDPRNREVVKALDKITSSGEDVYVCVQVLREYWAMATRPAKMNGLGLSSYEADETLSEFQKLCPCVHEPADLPAVWRDLVQEHGVTGIHTHDARIAAVMVSHGITHLLTLNPIDFACYSEITAVTPSEII